MDPTSNHRTPDQRAADRFFDYQVEAQAAVEENIKLRQEIEQIHIEANQNSKHQK